MPSINSSGNGWGSVRHTAPAPAPVSSTPTPSPTPTPASTPAASPPSPAATEPAPVAVSQPAAPPPPAAAPASVATSSLLNLYHQALSTNAADQNQSWITVAPPQQTDPAQVPEAAARTSAEIMARAAYALVADASTKRGDMVGLVRKQG